MVQPGTSCLRRMLALLNMEIAGETPVKRLNFYQLLSWTVSNLSEQCFLSKARHLRVLNKAVLPWGRGNDTDCEGLILDPMTPRLWWLTSYFDT